MIKYTRVFFETDAMDYPLGKEIYAKLKQAGNSIEFLKSHNRVTGIPGKNPREAFFQGKKSLVVGIRKTLDFLSCKPSAEYQLPLVTGCTGMCEYCYLNTNLGKKPYTRIYVNIDDILAQAKKLIVARQPEITFFEASATSDPLVVEDYSGALAKAIDFFAAQDYGRLRFVSKFNNIDSLLNLNHQKHTRIRMSISPDSIISKYEHGTPSAKERINTLQKILKHNYPAGILIAPVFLDENWQDKYLTLLKQIKNSINDLVLENQERKKQEKQVEIYDEIDLHFEIISHRFTPRARSIINEVFPENSLPMDENQSRQYKYGQFGYGKYVYEKDKLAEMKSFFQKSINEIFPDSKIEYII